MTKNIQHIFYINLDYRTDRKELFEQEMKKMGWESERYPAIYHAPPCGTVGASKSLLNVLKIAKERKYENVLIFQDDFLFTKTKEEVETKLQKLFDLKPNFDVCMLTCNLKNGHYENEFLTKVLFAHTASALLINGHYFDKLIDLYTESTPKLEATMRHWEYACDAVWTSLMEKDNWYCFTEYLGEHQKTFSDCANNC
jgi:hypothetical protein